MAWSSESSSQMRAEILRNIAISGELNRKQLMDLVKVPRATLNWNLTRMVRRGVLVETKKNTALYYRLGPNAPRTEAYDLSS